jgi:hypothetical protein
MNMHYYNPKTKETRVPCHLHTDALGKPLPCNWETCTKDCNYKDWQNNGTDKEIE